MTIDRNVHPSLQIDPTLLKKDRRDQGYTQASFCAACASVSLATIRRAEQGHRIAESSLKRMATVLGHNFERYIASNSALENHGHAASLAGEWTSFYVEADIRGPAYMVTQTLSLRQSGGRLEGEIVSQNPLPRRVGKINNGQILNQVVTGFTVFDTRVLPAGMAYFYQVATRENNWLEGFCTWYGPGTDTIETSRIIAVRKNQARYFQFLEEAKATMADETISYRLRKLTETGYSIHEAVKMLAALDEMPVSNVVNSETAARRVEHVKYLTRTQTSYTDLIKRLIELDAQVTEQPVLADFGPIDTWVNIFKSIPETWRILTQGDKIDGCWHFCALPPESLERVKNGELRDSEISIEHVSRFTFPGSYSIYITALTSLPSPSYGEPLKMLFDSAIVAFEKFARQSIFIDEIVILARTPAMLKIVQRLDFTHIRSFQRDGAEIPVYTAKLVDLLQHEDLSEFPILRQIYLKR